MKPEDLRIVDGKLMLSIKTNHDYPYPWNYRHRVAPQCTEIIRQALLERKEHCERILNELVMSGNAHITANSKGIIESIGNMDCSAHFSFVAYNAINNVIADLGDSKTLDFNEFPYKGIELIQITKAVVEWEPDHSRFAGTPSILEWLKNYLIDQLVCDCFKNNSSTRLE